MTEGGRTCSLRSGVAASASVDLAGGEKITIGGVEMRFETASGFAELIGSLSSDD